MLICDTIKKCRRRGPRVVYVKKLGLSERYQTVLRRPRKESDKYFFKNTLKFGKSVQKKVVKLYYRKIEGNRDLPADDRAKPTVTAARFLLFIKKLSPVVGLLTFFKNFSFRRFNSARPLRQGFCISPCRTFPIFSKTALSYSGAVFVIFFTR